VQVVDEDGESYLRITQPTEGGYCIIETEKLLDPSWARLRVEATARVRDLVKGDPPWKMSRVEVQLLGSDQRVDVIHCESADWQTYAVEFDVPLEAMGIKVLVGFWESSGTLDIQEVRLEVVESRQLTDEQRRAHEALVLGDREPQDIVEGSYYAALREEFRGIGPAYFLTGSTEQETFAHLEGDREVLSVEGQPFSYAVRIAVPERTDQPWMANVSLFSGAPVYEGDATLVVFWARGTKRPQPVDDGAGAVVQPLLKSHVGGPKYGQLTDYHQLKELAPEWKRYWIKAPEPSRWDFPSGQLELLMMLGHKAQDVEIGGIAWMVFPEGSDLSQMPQRTWAYLGRDPDADWRDEAERRIDRLRKGTLEIRVEDAAGAPIQGATVRAEMVRHRFPFGTAVSARAFHGLVEGMDDEDRQRYREISCRYFNQASPENALKWKLAHLGEIGRIQCFQPELVQEMLDYYRDEQMRMRGHVLVWPSLHHTPEDVRREYETSSEVEVLRQAVRDHVAGAAIRHSQHLDAWDVTNETNGNRDYMDLFGAEEMVEWYRLAREADPDCWLVFNEPGTFCDEGWISGSFLDFGIPAGEGWIGYLLEKGAPLDALGTQMHGGLEDPEATWARWDEMQERFGLPMEITELDITIDDASDPEQLAYQADKLRDSLIAAFAHPMISGVQLWGFWEKAHWFPNAALWRADWSIKPIGQAYIDLVYDRWWTDETMDTGTDGLCTVRGFAGDYQLTVVSGDVTVTQAASVEPGETSSVLVVVE
jgi:GH35 family endo-1,4-beta-xylanase